MELDTVLPMKAGLQRAFYVGINKASKFKYRGGYSKGAIVESNDQIILYAGRTNQPNFGSLHPTSGFQRFYGAIKYNYGYTECYDDCIDDISTMPSMNPTIMPSEISSDIPSTIPNTNPSAIPSPIPSSVPGSLPTSTPSLTPSIEPSYQCIDSSLKFRMKNPHGKRVWKRCKKWVNKKQCEISDVAKACPLKCGTCSKCRNSPYPFRLIRNGKEKEKDCKWVKNKPESRCEIEGVAEACRKICGRC